MKIGGMDPGSFGAVCVLDTNNLAHPTILDFTKASIYELAKWLYDQKVDRFIIEEVHSLHGMSAKSNFNFGRNLGKIESISQVLTKGVLAKTVQPKQWQKFIGVTTKGNDSASVKKRKQEIAQIALSLYPNLNLYGPKGGLKDGRADAAMIAHYGLHHL